MSELVEFVLFVVVLSAVGLPLVVFTLAQFGYFDPIEFELFGKTWNFAPPRQNISARSNGVAGVFPRHVMFSGAVSTFLIAIATPQPNVAYMRNAYINTANDAIEYARDDLLQVAS